jgi:hypothetical protein
MALLWVVFHSLETVAGFYTGLVYATYAQRPVY